MYVCLYVCMYVCMYVCIYVYIICINVSNHFELLTPDLKFAQDLTLKILPAVKPWELMCLIQMSGALCSKNVII